MSKLYSHIYVASHDKHGGISHYALYDSGRLELIKKYPLDHPTYISAENNRLFVLLREPFPGKSGVVAFSISSDGSLKEDAPVQSTCGSVASYILALNNVVYCTNYMSGTTVRLPDKTAVHAGRGIDPVRQDASHPHCIVPTPDNKYLCVADLGTDHIYVYDRELVFVSSVKLPDGSGPRHIAFSDAGSIAYCVNELSSAVSVLNYHEGNLNYIRSFSTLPLSCSVKNTAAAIRLYKNRLYVSNRGHDSIAVFEIAGSELYTADFIQSGGRSPRDFNITGEFMLCANEISDNISIFRITENGILFIDNSVEVKTPWCVLPYVSEINK